MSLKKTKHTHHVFHAAAVLPTAMLSVGLTISAPMTHATIAQPEEIVVTARRTEEVIQNVPIAMTVFNQEMLNERNVVNGADLANYTPSLSVNTRFGSDQTTFAIRGFTQELKTAASVAVYFADVVAPRGGSANVTAGDGAGPGSFFDLQNVQVLKGPQGTLFGRNTTGGAIQLVPQEPTSKLEGYLEESLGNYNMHRTQGVINVPLNDMARARFGVDTQKRDGYIKNVSGIGPNHISNVNYLAGRASLILDLPNSIQNYTVMTYTNSENNGSIQGLFACDPNGKLQPLCQATLDKQGGDFYAIASGDVDNPVSKFKQWQLINTTTWDLNTDFTVKNILSYADLKQSMRGSTFGTDFVFPDVTPNGLAGSHLLFLPAQLWPGTPTNSQTTFVEELRFQGVSLSSKLNWQAGLYFENSKPDGVSGASAPGFIVCPGAGLSNNPSTWNCNDPLSVFASALGLTGFSGAVQSNLGTIEYLNEAIYSQATYDITDEFRVTGGLRYTVDTTKGESQQILYTGFPAFPPAGGPNPVTGQCVIGAADANCNYHIKQRSEAPTWLIDFDYLPTPDTMYYAKYARGYRQGSVNIFGPEGIQTFEPEKVNAYEIGSKNSFHGSIPGTFNISAFYNELSNQQIQANYLPDGHGTATTAILNAGSSTIQGVEVETTLRLLKDLSFNLSYTYLQTKLNQLNQPTLYAGSLIQYQQPIAAAEDGGHLSFSPRHTAMAALSYRLPVPAQLGDVSIGGSYTYVDEQVSTNSPTYGTLPSHHLVNLNLDWKNIAGSNFDASMFATNVTREKYVTYVPGLYDQGGMEFRVVGEPRMFGARVKYNFGK